MPLGPSELADAGSIGDAASRPRGDLMRQIAALYVRLDSLGHDEKSAERKELKQQIDALTKQMMA